MTPDNIDTEALRELEAKATPGPWEVETKEHLGENEAVIGESYRVVSNHYSDETPGVCGNHSDDWTLTNSDAEFIVALRNAAPALLDEIEAQRKEIEEARADSQRWVDRAAYYRNLAVEAGVKREAFDNEHDRSMVDAWAANQAERDALKAEVEAERNEARGYREQFKTAVGHYTTLRARLGLDGFATVEEVLRKVDTLRSKLSASEAEVERLRAAYSDKVLEALKLRAVLAEARNMLTIGDPKCDRAARAIAAALRGEEAPRG